MNNPRQVLQGGDLVKFAEGFARWNLERFDKDVSICLSPNSAGKHAYFPCLMACIGVLDMFSGLYAGTLEPRLSDLKNYAKEFMPNQYEPLLLAILYNCFRHKVAHLAHPYDVLDTHARRTAKDFDGEPRRLITWRVDETDASPSLSLEPLSPPILIGRAPDGWGVKADHRVHVHLKRLSTDIVFSITKTDGYLDALRTSDAYHANFAKCMREYFPT